MKPKYLSLIRRLGNNKTIIAIARELIEIIFTMLTGNLPFVDKIDGLTRKKIVSMKLKEIKQSNRKNVTEAISSMINV